MGNLLYKQWNTKTILSRQLKNNKIMKIEGINLTADEGKTLIRIHDGYDMGNGIQLGIDTSTGVPREDKPEYYKEVDIPEVV